MEDGSDVIQIQERDWSPLLMGTMPKEPDREELKINMKTMIRNKI